VYGYWLAYDISLNSQDFYRCVEEIRTFIANSSDFKDSEKESILVAGFGHIGDGNLHICIAIPGHEDTALQHKLNTIVEPFVMEFVKHAKGSISAEHGIGFQKTDILDYSKSKPMIEYMERIKNVFDPNGILNPYKLLPQVK
jgi:FAD/FMN-containing dehydrogenase